MTPQRILTEMTAIDLFMLHAPAAPNWFEPNMRAYENLRPDPEKVNEVEAWCKLVDREQCLQWPLFWAQQQVTRSEAGPAQFAPAIVSKRTTRRTK